jgi:threonylcarbamoyladenosine tRNA methylthiotransferase MtaB
MPQALAQVGADLIVDNEQKPDLVKLIIDRCIPTAGLAVSGAGGIQRIRSFIKIQDGCSSACAYCVVPQVRRREYSLPVDEIVDMIKGRVADGYHEVVLTGTKIGTYNYEGIDLRHLLERILAETEVVRLHLSSLQPQEISPELLGLWLSPRLCRHFHLALQSGSDIVLKRMRRRYSIDDYMRAVSLIRQLVPAVAITTDIMVGFPGESDAEFEESYNFCRGMGFADIHVFAYSARPGTVAVGMQRQVRDKVKKERTLKMLELAQQATAEFAEKLLGRTSLILWENEVTPGSGVYSGLSDNYVRVFTQSYELLTNRLLPTKLLRVQEQGLWGKVIDED